MTTKQSQRYDNCELSDLKIGEVVYYLKEENNFIKSKVVRFTEVLNYRQVVIKETESKEMNFKRDNELWRKAI